MIQLTTDVLRVSDPDSSPAELIFSSLGNSSGGGHLEDRDSPGRFVPQTINLRLTFTTDKRQAMPRRW